jgi:hypothetical protein
MRGVIWRAWKRPYCAILRRTDQFHRWLHKWAGAA